LGLSVEFRGSHFVYRMLTVRQLAAVGVTAVGLEAVLSAAAPDDPNRRQLVAHVAPAGLPSLAHVLALLVGGGLVALAPKLWRGTRTAASLAIAALLLLATLDLAKGLAYDEAALEVSLASLIAVALRAFPLGSRNRPRALFVFAAVGTWALAYLGVLIGPAATDHVGVIRRVLRHTSARALGPAHLSDEWIVLIEVLIGAAAVISALAIRSMLRPAAGGTGHAEHEYWEARAITERYGDDSLSPFALRPDKALHFAAGGVLAYRLIGETAVVSGDPIAPPGKAPRVLASFLALARRRGWEVALWGASSRNLDDYRALGLQARCAGEEAFVDPARFTLEGRRVRKLRQSVHRVERRGWRITACEGRDLDDALEAQLDELEAKWRAKQRRLHGFAMGMGSYTPDVRPADLYLLARSPEGDLRAAMRFIDHCGKLSLDTMRRVGDTPNGCNEALVARALELARERGVREVSLNYAGLAHLVRDTSDRTVSGHRLRRLALRALGRRFQLERLVCFNEKFHPEWRPRFLVYESPTGLPRTVMRVLQAEGYLPRLRSSRLGDRLPARPSLLPGSAQIDAAG
jgi:lysyl-tRNA synthetase, class II